MCCTTISLLAQLKVDNVGNVGVGVDDPLYKLHIYSSSSDANQSALRVYNHSGSGNYSYAGYFYNPSLFGSSGGRNLVGVSGMVALENHGGYYRGVFGRAISSTAYSSGRSYGVYGMAGNCTTGYNYGVYGELFGSNNGAGVFGTDGTGVSAIDGQYAGYFLGDVKITGDCYANSYTPSDKTLKKDIKSLDKQNEKLNKLSGYTFKYTEDYFVSQEEKRNLNDTAKVEIDFSNNKILKRTYYGLIAQEVQEVYPNLVDTMPNGKLAINYNGFIPILIEAYKEQRTIIDSLSNAIDAMQKYLGLSENNKINSKSAVLPLAPQDSETFTETNTASISQNRPNPFPDNTTIEYYLPKDVETAYIYIYDLNGKQLKNIVLYDRGNRSININNGDLYAGLFNYALVVDNELIDTKRMILTK